MQERQEKVSNYYESYYKFLNPNFNLEWYTSLIWNDFGSSFSEQKDISILDIGCGTGQLLKVLETKGYTNLTGVELDKGQYEAAKEYIPKAKLFNDDLLNFFKKSTEKFDMILMIDVIEHMSKNEVVEILSQIREHLKPGGTFIIRTPNADSTLIAPRFRYIDFTHNFILNQESMGTILREASFKVFSFKGSYIPRSGIKKLIWGTYQKIFDTLLRLYIYSYIHEAAKRMILTPNFITIAKA